ncbi:hypothetical protein BBK36DRAFT_56830 [Trichoderma citrinoviride]|uniref:FHA domain-containing protein n=1 Tax=Trichoderma citrinoviride TaxID=58853 RepID=A0A2T4B6I2_9HYPO|nr:hypothetical protein BBK36DRAFT_56830 [Trichoderma citrinoviride]PTB64888.1 hypothetical protein BBK36DRAFT_56830 [Trichoderma citrinoviride]
MDSTRGPAAEPALPAPTLAAASSTSSASSASSASASASTSSTASASASSSAPAPATASTAETKTASTSTTASASSSSSASASGSPLKRPAPSLLPPFEPLSSSPGLPRPSKRQNVGTGSGTGAHLRYPTPVPTSSTGILSSSPLREKMSIGLLERAPLSAVPSIELNENGETLLMGRSSNSSHFQLSANRLISRVHVRARYVQAATPLEASKIEITCNGWNGLKLHCQGRTWELLKGDSFTSETEGTEIMVDVHDARVLIQWPKRSSSAADANGLLSDASWEDSPPPASARASAAAMLQASPLRRAARIQSPDSPTPAPRRRSVVAADEDAGIQIYEDDDDDDYMPDSDDREDPDVAVSMRTEATASFSSDEGSGEDDESDPDEENDPVVLSFGPYGANISTRLASITTKSPRVTKRSLKKGSSETPRPSKSGEGEGEGNEDNDEDEEPTRIPSEADAAISNHVVNQLAFSRLSSTPLSTIMHNLPAEQIKDISRDALRLLIETTPCIGIIKRQGKDAAGKPLESEYYYIPEDDTDMQRRAAVVDGLRKPSLRACRKQHKQYYWKRPKTP